MRWFILLGLVLFVIFGPAWPANTYTDYRKTGGDGSGSDTSNAYLTIVAAVQAAHTGGDTVWVHPAHIETLGEIADVLSDGTPAAPIVLKCDVDAEVWPATTTTVAITCGANYIYWINDDYWHVDNLRLLAFSVYGAYVRTSDGLRITNCTLDQPVATSDYGIYVHSCAIELEGCIFDGNAVGAGGADSGHGIYAANAEVRLANCTFDDQHVGMFVSSGSRLYVADCELGQTETNTTDIDVGTPSGFAAINSGLLNDNSLLTVNGAYPLTAYISRFYADASNRPMAYRKSADWNMITDYTTLHSGGGDYSLKVMTNVAAAGVYAPIKVLEYGAHCDSAEARDWTIYAYRNAAWGTAPTAEQFYLEATYIESSVSTATVVSTATMASESTWYPLTASSVTPVHDGPVMLTLWLKTTDTDGAIYIDPRPVTTTDETYQEYYLWGMPLASLQEAIFGGQVIILN